MASRALVALPSLAETSARDYPGVHNAVAYREGFISGSQPEGDAGFDTLRDMGIRTIISVDGSAPEVDKAEARGMRYIHLPIGYNGFDEERRLDLARATRDAIASGPIYIHCHHGKHRSAGAAAAVASGLGWLTPEQGVDRMLVSGTAKNYTGLYACAANSQIIAMSVLDSRPGEYPSVSHPSNFVQAMVEIDHAMEHLKAIERAGWKVPADHPDLVPVAEAGRLADLLRISAAGERAKSKPVEFAELLMRNSAESQTLEDLLGAPNADVQSLSAQLKIIARSCTDCHKQFRD